VFGQNLLHYLLFLYTLYQFYSSPNIVRLIKLAGHAAHVGQMRNAYKSMVRKPEGKSPRCRWEDNIRVDLREMEREGVKSICLDQEMDQRRAPVNAVVKFRFP